MRTESRYPLSWPAGWKRTALQHRTAARFGKASRNSGTGSWQPWRAVTIAEAVDRVRKQLEHMGIHDDDLLISTNLQLRLDGLPRSNQGEPVDPGVAVYWQERGKRDQEPKCMAIDRYDRVADNLAAIAATLDAMRAIERHGGGEILARAFAGFTALAPPVDVRTWWQVLGVSEVSFAADVEAVYRRLRSAAHPDRPGGDAQRFNEVQAAYEQFKHERGVV